MDQSGSRKSFVERSQRDKLKRNQRRERCLEETAIRKNQE
jgi:hypothetical protein